MFTGGISRLIDIDGVEKKENTCIERGNTGISN